MVLHRVAIMSKDGDWILREDDFFTRPPRLAMTAVERLFTELEGADPPVIGLEALAEMKKTNRERDYAVIGELARRMESRRSQLLYARSARDLIAIGATEPELTRSLAATRPVLRRLGEGRDAVEVALDAERRELMRKNEVRLERYQRAAAKWAESWPSVEREIAGLELGPAHSIMVARALGTLPFTLAEDADA